MILQAKFHMLHMLNNILLNCVGKSRAKLHLTAVCIGVTSRQHKQRHAILQGKCSVFAIPHQHRICETFLLANHAPGMHNRDKLYRDTQYTSQPETLFLMLNGDMLLKGLC